MHILYSHNSFFVIVSSMNCMQAANHIFSVKIIKLNCFRHLVCIFRSVCKSNVAILTKFIILGSITRCDVGELVFIKVNHCRQSNMN